jgi:ribA/ribD-fused uncharacterized protein
MESKMSSRFVTFRSLLDFYDHHFGRTSSATQTSTGTQSTQSMALVPAVQHASQSQAHPQRQQESDSDPIVVKGKDNPLSNFYGFDFFFNGLRFRSLEHAYQCMKATRLGMYVLADRIRLAPTPAMAKRFASSLPSIPQAELFDLMKELLTAKAEQCYSFRKKLRETVSAKIFHSTYYNVDTYWCTGLNYWDIFNHRMGKFHGKNVLGRLLEEVREQLGEESEYHKNVDVKFVNGMCYILYDGEDMPCVSNSHRRDVGRKARQGFQRRGGR